jgi:hypothetical protein
MGRAYELDAVRRVDGPRAYFREAANVFGDERDNAPLFRDIDDCAAMGDVLFKHRGCDAVDTHNGDEAPSLKSIAGAEGGAISADGCGQRSVADAADDRDRREPFFFAGEEKGIFIWNSTRRFRFIGKADGGAGHGPKSGMETEIGPDESEDLQKISTFKHL